MEPKLLEQPAAARRQLVMEGINFQGQALAFLAKIPFPNKADNSTSKLSIWNIPISVANSKIEKELKGFGLCLGSPFKEEIYRDAEGRLTRFKLGRRYVYIDLPNIALPESMKIGHNFLGFFILQRARGRKV